MPQTTQSQNKAVLERIRRYGYADRNWALNRKPKSITRLAARKKDLERLGVKFYAKGRGSKFGKTGAQANNYFYFATIPTDA